MGETARIESIGELRAFRVALVKFVDACNVALGDAESDMQRTLTWVERDQLAFWNGQLSTAQDQGERWNRTSRTYSFPLSLDTIRTDRAYVLAATFELTSGGRFFDRIVMEPRERAQPTAAPAATNPTRSRATSSR